VAQGYKAGFPAAGMRIYPRPIWAVEVMADDEFFTDAQAQDCFDVER